MKDDLFERLREASWTRRLTPEEQVQLNAWLNQHPETREGWQVDQGLNEALDSLRAVPVSSNFTARTIEAAQREARNIENKAHQSWLTSLAGLRWIPKLAAATIILAAGLFAYHEIHQAKLSEIRESLITISDVPSLANPEILQDFDAIEVMSQTPNADEDLLRLMQ